MDLRHPSVAFSGQAFLSRLTSRRFFLLALLLCLFPVAGCGSGPDGPERFALYGTVTREGKPLANGAIKMAPTAGGPSTQTKITDGEYEFNSQNGPVAGEQEVSILRFLEKPEPTEGMSRKDMDVIPETGFDSPMPVGGWWLQTTVSPDQDLAVDFNVDEAKSRSPEKSGKIKQ